MVKAMRIIEKVLVYYTFEFEKGTISKSEYKDKIGTIDLICKEIDKTKRSHYNENR